MRMCAMCGAGFIENQCPTCFPVAPQPVRYVCDEGALKNLERQLGLFDQAQAHHTTNGG